MEFGRCKGGSTRINCGYDFLKDRAALSNTVKSGVGVTMRNGSTTELKAFGEKCNANLKLKLIISQRKF
jgi:hypothetical protein